MRAGLGGDVLAVVRDSELFVRSAGTTCASEQGCLQVRAVVVDVLEVRAEKADEFCERTSRYRMASKGGKGERREDCRLTEDSVGVPSDHR